MFWVVDQEKLNTNYGGFIWKKIPVFNLNMAYLFWMNKFHVGVIKNKTETEC